MLVKVFSKGDNSSYFSVGFSWMMRPFQNGSTLNPFIPGNR